ncbi:Coatomer subunit delta [Thelohanellus kitauei]|uniref:Coatomer subunit delta n=1 Tax=Thelohanellus kitauei TaxID=669202 RepID=A0A0C2IS79_THEKT|nr:Coatomer subunit delta [Thelohanellus kitauei]
MFLLTQTSDSFVGNVYQTPRHFCHLKVRICFIVLTWVTEESNGCIVTIECQPKRNITVRDISICIPQPPKCKQVVVKEISTGTFYNRDVKKNILEWKIPELDVSTRDSVSIEIGTDSGTTNNFYPVSVSFTSPNVYNEIKVTDVFLVSDQSSIPFTIDYHLTTDSYQIV